MTADDKSGLEALFAAAAVCFAIGFWIRRRENAARAWPKISGKIVTSEIISQQGPQLGTQLIKPVIEYEFDYEGQPFRSGHWRFGNFSVGDRASAEPIISRYPVGSIVTIYVNQEDPMNSVLEHSPSGLSWVPLGLGVFFLGIFSLAFLACSRK